MPVRRAANLERHLDSPASEVPAVATMRALWLDETTHGTDPHKRRDQQHLPELMLPSDSGRQPMKFTVKGLCRSNKPRLFARPIR